MSPTGLLFNVWTEDWDETDGPSSVYLGVCLFCCQMIHLCDWLIGWSRYHLAALPALLNAATMMGFMILNCILGGETLASVSDGSLSWNVGIVIIAIVSLFVSGSYGVGTRSSTQSRHCRHRYLFAGIAF